MFFTQSGYWPHGGGFPKRLVHNLLMQFFTLGSSKIEVFETCFFEAVTTCNDHRRYVKHILRRICLCLTQFGCHVQGGWGGGAPKGLVDNLLLRFFTLDSSKIKVFKSCFYYTMMTKMTI